MPIPITTNTLFYSDHRTILREYLADSTVVAELLDWAEAREVAGVAGGDGGGEPGQQAVGVVAGRSADGARFSSRREGLIT